jgi:hypothetical protein
MVHGHLISLFLVDIREESALCVSPVGEIPPRGEHSLASGITAASPWSLAMTSEIDFV